MGVMLHRCERRFIIPGSNNFNGRVKFHLGEISPKQFVIGDYKPVLFPSRVFPQGRERISRSSNVYCEKNRKTEDYGWKWPGYVAI